MKISNVKWPAVFRILRLILAVNASVSAEIIYVSASAPPGGSGTSWSDAYNSLQDGLDDADPCDQIWVSAGTYIPTTLIDPCDPRTATFQMKNGVAIYGGFPSNGDPNFSDRAPNTYLSILSGDLLANDDPCTPVEHLLNDPCRAENAYTVVYVIDTEYWTTIDGFTLTAGNANEEFTHGHKEGGGGMYNESGSMTVKTCIFIKNSAYSGGGLNIDESFKFIQCVFKENMAKWSGGGIVNSGSNTIFMDCSFLNNFCYWMEGGGIFNGGNQPLFSNCIFWKNEANYGGGMTNFYSSPTIQCCIFKENLGRIQGGGISNGESSPIINDCIFQKNKAESKYYDACSGGGIICYHSNPIINHCTFTGNKTLSMFSYNIGGGMVNMNLSNSILKNCTFCGNAAKGESGGIYNASDSNINIENSVLWNNYDLNGCGETSQIYINPATNPECLYYNCIQGWTGNLGGTGNIGIDPCFVDPGRWDDPCNTPSDPTDDIWVEGDYHLKSSGWRWDATRQRWDYDNVTSRCIDAGNPGSPLADELLTIPDDPTNEYGENIRINMGAYGGTSRASMPPYDWSLLADLTNDGTVNLLDFAGQTNYWLQSDDQQPGDFNRDGIIDIADLSLLLSDWLAITSWFE